MARRLGLVSGILLATAGLLLQAHPSAAAAARGLLDTVILNTTNPLDFCDSNTGSEFAAAVSPPADNVCAFLREGNEALAKLFQDLGLNGTDVSFSCWVTGIVEDYLAPTTAAPRLSYGCDPNDPQEQPPRTSRTGALLPAPLPDRRPLPSRIKMAKISATERASYYWHFTVITNLYKFASCGFNGTQFLPPTGWTLLGSANSTSTSLMPLMTLLVSPAGTQLVVTVRGTLTAEDWLVDFDYRQIKSKAFPGLLHRGYLRLYKKLWPLVERVLDDHVLPQASAVRHVSVSGHSMGAALGAFIAHQAQAYLDANLPTGRSVRVGAVLFAPPTIGNTKYVKAYNKLVNGRRLAFQYDLIPQLLCKQAAACANTEVPTVRGLGNKKAWSYGYLGGTVAIRARSMPAQADVWKLVNTVDVCAARPFMSASHFCPYPCWSSPYVDTAQTFCLLHAEADNSTVRATNSYCVGGFPFNPPYPPPRL